MLTNSFLRPLGHTVSRTITLSAVAVLAFLVFLVACKKGGVQADVDTAVAKGQLQFIALMDEEGKLTLTQVPGIPDWYFQRTGLRFRRVTADTKDAEMAYMKSYNEALYQTLKAQGKFQAVLDDVARVKTNSDNIKQ